VREAFHGDLTRLGQQLAGMSTAAAAAMREATRALLSADLELAEQVISADTQLDALRAECEERTYALLALQAPVARDLRIVLAAAYCAEKVERMGDLAAHPAHAVPAELEATFADLGQIAASMADRLAELETTDCQVDQLHAGLLTTITAVDFPHGPKTAASLALVGRFYERFAEQAVSVAKRLDFAATVRCPPHSPSTRPRHGRALDGLVRQGRTLRGQWPRRRPRPPPRWPRGCVRCRRRPVSP
jgi:phosphate transport system protein